MVLRAKRVSYGYVELCQNGNNYFIKVNGAIKEHSTDYGYMVRVFENQYR